MFLNYIIVEKSLYNAPFRSCNVMYHKKDKKENIWYSALEWKVTVFSAIHFSALSYPVFVSVFVQNNHGCLSVMQFL